MGVSISTDNGTKRWNVNKGYWAKLPTITKHCVECSNPFQTKNPKRLYCTPRCKSRVSDRKDYWKNQRNNPEFMERNRVNVRKWRDRMHKEGRCDRCGAHKITEGLLCSICIEQLQVNKKE